MSKFYAEFGEDKWISEHIKLPEIGFYLDLGCAWPCLNSTTAFLRDRGWSGINIDGNPVYAPNWDGVGLFTNCVIGDGKPVQFEINGVPELSRIGSGEITPTRRLDDLLQFSPSVDFIACDLEGAEFDALCTFDWKKHKPPVVVSEYNTYGLGEDFRVKEMLEKTGYLERYRTKANLIFTL
jgi:Methyltransferase FkbM domain